MALIIKNGLAAALTLVAVSAGVASDKSACAAMAGPTIAAADAFASMYNTLSSASVDGALMSNFTGDDLAALLAFEEARQEMIPVMKRFLESTQDLGYRMQRCSR